MWAEVMNKGRSQNGVGDMCWPTDKGGLVDNLGTFFLNFIFQENQRDYYKILFYFLIYPLTLSHHLLLFPLV